MTEQRPQVTRLKTGKSGRTVGCGFGQLFQESVTTVEEYSDPDGFLRGLVVRLTHWLHKFICLLYTSPSPRDRQKSRMPSSA